MLLQTSVPSYHTAPCYSAEDQNANLNRRKNIRFYGNGTEYPEA